MENSELDRRVRYTRNVIRESFLKFLEEKPIGRITVKEICENADINRATFYAHYADVYELLEKIEEEFYREVSASAINMKKEGCTGILPLQILNMIKQNEELCMAMFGKYGDKEFLGKMMYFAMEESMTAWEKLYPDVEKEKLEWLYEFIVNGCAGIIQNWAKSGFRAEPKEISLFMALMYTSCVKGMEELNNNRQQT